jgi:ABC-type transport system involved in cytochrome c biogenesis permease subunit
MRFGIGVLALLVAATIPALIVAGSTSLRGLGWLLLIGAAVVLLIDFTDRVTDWIERRRRGR